MTLDRIIEETTGRPAPIRETGGLDEINALVQASHVRTLTDAERLRLAGMTFTTDEAMERARLVRDRHPDVFGRVPSGTQLGLSKTYEPAREAAKAAGRTVADPSDAVVAEIDELVELYRSTIEMPAHLADFEKRRRAAFRAAVAVPDVNEALRGWSRWLADHAERDRFLAKRSRASRAFGGSDAFSGTEPPRFLTEFEAAVGGSRPWALAVRDAGVMVE